MQTVAGFPYLEVEFTKDGGVGNAAEVTALHDFISGATTTDLIVISHGWNNDIAEARDLYARFLACARRVLDGKVVAADTSRSFGVTAVLWPSITFADDDLIPGGRVMAAAESVAIVEQQLDRLERALKAPEKAVPLRRARALIPELQPNARARAEFADLIRSVLPATDVEPDDGSNVFFSRSGEDVMKRLAGVVAPEVAAPAGQRSPAAMGRPAERDVGADVDEAFTGGLSAARNLLNYSTYYLMKERAGTVGRRGLNGVLRQLKAVEPKLRIHLVGHSFGARLVTAAADGPAGRSELSVMRASTQHVAPERKEH